MKYFLLITNSDGETRLVPISDVMDVSVAPGDDIVVMDESGNAVDVSLRPEEDDLVVEFEDGSKAILKDFYNQEEDAEPVTISLNPVEPVADDYEFNSQTGNLPNAKSFTLMRFSNTEYVQFVEQLDELRGGVIEGALQDFNSRLGSGSEPVDSADCCDDEDLILDPVPAAAPDSGSGIDGNLINIDLLANDTDARGDGLEIHSVGGIGVISGNSVTLESGSQVTVNEDGTIDFLPGSSFDSLQVGESGTETFVYSIRDGGGNIATSEVTVTVEGINDPPVANPDEYELTEDAPITVEVLGNDSDPDTSDTLTVVGISTPPGGSAIVNGDNTVTFDPSGDFEYLGAGESTTVELTYTISDDRGATATSTVTFTISGQNDAPDAIDDLAATDQDTPIVIDVVSNDIDPDTSDALLIIGFDQPSKGTVTLNSQNQLIFDPGDDFDFLDANEDETVGFNYTISDGNGGTATATVNVYVEGREDPTVTAPDEDVTDENTPVVVDVLANDTDPDANDIPLTVTSVTQPGPGQGSVVISNGGADVTFDPENDFDDLAVGEIETVTFTYTTDTGATEDVTITVTGTNDIPVAVNDTGSVNEDATLVVNEANGVIQGPGTDTDADGTDVLEVSAIRTGAESGSGTGALVGNPLVGTYGTLTLSEDGSYSYVADQDAADPLAVGVTATDTFTYEISDGNGGTDTAELVITVTGTNDAPLPNPPGGTPGVDPGVYDDEDTIAEDAVVPAIGNVLANDVDLDIGDVLEVSEVNGVAGNVDNPVVGTYGTVTIDQDGDYSYALDNTNPVVQALAVGESTTDTFTYTADDGNGGSATATLTITINGVNDVPPENPPGGTPGVDFGVYDDSNSIAEDEFPNSVIGNVLSNDLDPDGDTLTVSEVDGSAANTGSQVDGTFGTVVIDEDGSYNYTLDNSNPAIQALAVGATTTDTFTYTADDGNGGTATATLTITITGTNDAPLPNPPGGTPGVDPGVYDDEDTIAEDAPAPATGNVLANDVDPDTGDVLEVSEVNGVAGNVDNPVVGTYGTVTIDQDGDYSYALDNTNPVVQALAVGETTTDTFTYTADDGNGGSATATLTITITGTNDVPPENPPGGTPGVDFGVYDDSNTVAEETVVPVTGDVLANDLDPDGDTLTVAAVDGVAGNVDNPVAGAYGTVTIEEDGSYSYLLDNSNPTVQELGVGQSTTDTFTYTADDGNGGTATANLTITITGTNDAPVAVDDSGVGDEDTSITGNVVTNDSDIDGDTPLTVVSNTTPAHGTLVIAANGAYTYTPDPDYNGLDSFTYTIEDPNGGSDTATVTLTINPANDPPIAVDDSGVAEENAPVTIDVLDNDSDIEGDTLTVTSIDDSGLTGGSATLNVDSTVTFDPGSDFDDLAVGETATETLTYVVEDGNGGSDTATITVTIEGQNDDPIAVNDTGSVNEDATLTVNAANGVIQGPGTDTDADGTDVLEVSAIRTGAESGTGTGALVGNPLVGTYGTLTLAEDGSYTYVADQDAADPLAVGVTATDTFTYEINDSNGGTDTAELVITITGTNDAPLPNPPGGTPGVDPGVYDDEDTIAEDAVAPAVGNVLANDVDLDIGDVLEVSEVNGVAANVDNPVSGTYGTVVINQDGSYGYALDNTNPVVQALAVGESTTETFTYTADDGNGGSATATLTITINGVNDVPPENPPGGTPGVDFGVYDDSNSIAEDEFPNSVIGNVLSNDLDPDGDTLTVSEVDGSAANTGSQVDGTFGTVVIDEDGSYNYTLDNSNPAIQALAVGATTTDTFTYTADDGNGGTATATLTITITGTNDAPLPNPPGGTPGVDPGVYDDEDTIAEDAPAPATGNVLANDVDPDTGDVLEVSEVNGVAGNVDNPVVGIYGTVTIDQDGDYSYALDNTNPVVQALAVGETTTDTFTYTADDGNGGSATATLTITITGTNDAPLPNPPGGTPGVDFGVYDDENTIAEETVVPVTGDVLANDLDPDGDTLTVAAVDGVAGNVDTPVSGTYGTVTIDEDGSYSYLLDNSNPTVQELGVGQSTTDTFTYTADDGNGGTATANLTITITGTNDAPVAVDDSGVGDEDTSITGNVVTNDSDVDGDTPLVVVSNTTPAHGTLVIAANGAYTYTPDPDYNGLDSFTYTIEDPNGGSDTATVTLTINPANDPPIAVDDSGVAEENAPVTIDVLDNDSDIEGDTLTVTSIDDSGLTGGTATLNGDSTVTFDPGTDFDNLAVGETATETLTYVVEDGNGGSDTATITVTIEGQNDDPIAVNDTGSVNEDATLTVTAANGVIQGPGTDTDADGTDVLEVSAIRTGAESGTGTGALVGNPVVGTYGTLTLSEDGSYTYAADQDAADPLAVGVTATDTFTYEISDGNGGTDTAELVITVTGTNDAPLPNPPGGTPGVDPGVYDDEDTIAEDAVVPAIGNVLANDVDLDIGDVLEVSEVNGVAGNVDNPVVGTYGTVTIDQDGDYSYALDNTNPVVQALAVGESTTDTFTYTADDGNGGSATATLTITINGVNDVPPENPPGGTPGVDFGVYDDSNSIAEDEFPNSVIGNVLSNDLDPDGDTLTVSEVDGSAANTGSQVDGTFGTVVIDEDGSYNYTLDNSNPAIQALAVGATTTDTFTYTADDGNGGTATATLTITITGTNDAPEAIDDSGSGDEDNDITGNVITNDIDIDGDSPLVVVSNTDPGNGSVVIAPNGGYTYTPDPDFNGTDSFTYTIEDPSGETDTATVTLTVNPVNDPPVAGDDDGVVEENDTVTIDVLDNDTDIDGDTLTVTSIDDSGLTGGTATLNGDNTITFDPGTDFENLAVGATATETLTYVVDDGNGGSDTATVTITIEGENDDPLAVDDSGVGDEDTSITGNVVTNDSDVDGDTPLTVVSNTTPAHGTLVIAANGAYTYTPDPDYNGLDSFTYTIEDGNGGSDTATVTLTINPANDPPIAVDDSGTAGENAPVTIDVLDNDSDIEGDTLTVTSIDDSGLTGGSATLNVDSTVTFDPGTDFDNLAVGETATETLTYVVEDGNGGSDTATITVTIEGQNDDPIAVNDTGSVNEDATLTVNAANGVIQGPGTDTDADGTDVLEVSAIRTGAESGTGTGALVGNPLVGTYGTLTLNDDGSYTYVADQDAADTLSVGVTATDTFTYEISDGNGGTDTAELVLTVTGTDDATATNPDSEVTNEDTPVVVDVLANDSDPDANDNPLTVTAVGMTNSGKGSVTITNGGQDVTFDPDGDFEDLAVGESETVTFEYTTSTGATETATITVEGRNDSPVAVDDAESVTQGGSTNIDLLGAGDSLLPDSDPDGDTLTVIEVDGALAGGSVNLSSGAVLSILADGTADYNPNGAFDYLDDGESAVDTFDYTISDGNGGTDTATVTVTVTGVDDALEADPDMASTTENAPVDIDVLANDEDPDTTDNPLMVQSVSQPALGSVTNNGTNVTFDPGTDFDDLPGGVSATTTFSYTVVNQDGATETETVTVTVVGENDAPDTHEDTLHTMEGIGRTLDVIQNDSDADNSQLTISEINGTTVTANAPIALASGAIVSVTEDGQVYFNPNGAYNPLGFGETATESFTYTVEDGDGGSSVETVSVVIDGVDNPVNVSGAYQVLSNQLYEIQLDPTDESIQYVEIGAPLPFNFNSIAFNANDELIYANATEDDAASGVSDGDIIQINPLTGQVVGNLGQFTNDQGESVPNFAGAINSDINVYYVNGPADSSGNTAYAIDLNTMMVTGIGSLSGADYGVDVTTGLVWAVNGTESYSLDPTSGITTTYTHGGLQDDGMTAANGTFGSMFADGDGNVQVTSNSGFGLYQLNTTTGALVRIGDAPATNSNDATGTRDTALPSASPFLFLDTDGSTNATNPNDVIRQYDPDGAAISIADSDVSIADLDGNTISSARIVLKNTQVGDTLAVSGALPGGITSSVTTEGGFLVLTLSGDASQGDYEDAIEAVTFENTAPGSPPADPRQIEITLTDVDDVVGNTATSIIFLGDGTGMIGARNVQTADQGYEDSIVLHEDDFDPTTGGATFNLIQNDSDEPMEIDSITQPPSGEGTVVNNDDGTITFDPGQDFQYLSEGETAITSFTYTSSTGENKTVTVTVHGENDDLNADPDSGETEPDVPLTIDVLANDEDPDTGDNPLALTAVTQPSDGVVTIVDNKANFDPNGDFDDLDEGETRVVDFIYTVTNADGVEENELVTVTVTGIANALPVAVDDIGATDQDNSIIIDAVANDTDADVNDTLFITAVDQPSLGSATITSGNQILFNPGNDFDNLDPLQTATVTFDYTISDGEGGSDTATVTVTVTGTEDPTMTTPDQGTTFEGSPITIDVTSNDSDPDPKDNPLVVTGITGPTDPNDGSVTFAGGDVTFTPGSNFDGLSQGQSDTTTFQYQTNSGATETVTITVNGLNSPTVTNPDSETTDEDTPVNVDVLANDSDPDVADSPLTINLVTQPADPDDGTVVNNGTDITFTPGSNFQSLGPGDIGSSTFTYTTSTNETETVVVTVTGVNDAPVANDDFVVSTTDIDPVTVNVASNDSDVDGTLVLTSIDLDPTTAGQQTSLVVSGEGTWTVGGGGNVTFTPDPVINDQPSTITYSIADNDGATSTASLDLRYSAADVWFGNDESGSVNGADFNQSRNLISGAADQMSFATGDLAFNAALFTWSDSVSQGMELAITDNKTQFVSDSASYSRNFSGGTDIGQGIVFGTQQIVNHVSNMQSTSDPRADVPQVMVILTDAFDSQILNDASLLADAQAAKDEGIILVFVAIQEAQDNPVAVARLQQAASLDQNNDPLVITADSYADIDAASIADLLNTIREAAAAGLLPPVVIDMDGDGVEFDDIENGILFDADGDGVQERVAWADEDDAVLVYDENGNNDIDGLNEIAFARYADEIGATDLDGLRHFDSNDDLILDANDAEFESFKLWQDKNGDGVVDEGEMQTLTEAGIESLELTSDGQGYYTAGGDVQVHGEAAVNYADGSQGTLADSTFAYEELDSGTDELEILTDQGETLDVNGSGLEPGSADPDLLEPAPPVAGEASGEPVAEGGVVSGTSIEDDMAASDAAMS